MARSKVAQGRREKCARDKLEVEREDLKVGCAPRSFFLLLLLPLLPVVLYSTYGIQYVCYAVDVLFQRRTL